MRNPRNRHAMGYALGFAAFCLISALLSLLLILPQVDFPLPGASEPTALQSKFTVVIDAGHGGEDGGAVGGGLVEKDLNLDIALRLRALLEDGGVKTLLTRDEDILLYDRESDYRGKKKSQDLRRRLEITESTENPVLVSIHMNYFPQTQYSGLQVWYGTADASSKTLADLIQSGAKNALQPSNKRVTKAASSSIFLLHHTKAPAVLVECGFLSNPGEARALGDAEYRQKLAEVIFSAIVEYISQNNT